MNPYEIKVTNKISLEKIIEWIKTVDPVFDPETDKALVDINLVAELYINGIGVQAYVKTSNMSDWEELEYVVSEDTEELVEELHTIFGSAYELYTATPLYRYALAEETMYHPNIEVEFGIVAGMDT